MVKTVDANDLGRAIAGINQPGFENQLAQCLESLCHFDNFIVVTYERDNLPVVTLRINRDPIVHKQIDKLYIKHSYLLDPAYQIHMQMMTEGVYRLSDIAPDQFRRSEYYLRYYKRTRVIDEAIIAAHPATGVTVTLCLGRDHTSGRRFSLGDMESLRSWSPVFCSLINLNRPSPPPETPIIEPDKQIQPAQLISIAQSVLDIALTTRQAQVALYILQGYSSFAIAERLSISINTVKIFRQQLYRRCNISSQAQLFSLLMPLLNSY